MRIGIDARELCGHATGVGRYLKGLLNQWSSGQAAQPHDFVLYAPGDIALTLDTRRFVIRHLGAAGATQWEQLRLPRAATRDHLDVFFAPGYSAPLLLRVPAVVAIHDVSFAAHPEWFRFTEGARRRLLSRRSAQKARAIITISEFSRREIVERLETSGNKIHVIPPGIEPTRDPQPSRRDLSVLFVGSIFNRRHVPDLVRAFAPIARRHAGAVLDIVGENRSFPHEDVTAVAVAEGIESQVRWHKYVADDVLKDLYRRAAAFAFLSEYEGLGLTPLEALSAGVPPVLLDTPVARESCGLCALYVPPNDRGATTGALEALLFDDTTRARVLSGADAVLTRYDAALAASRTLAVLEASAK
jgi:glycosyltransferase involved in cell wall biosynthesis